MPLLKFALDSGVRAVRTIALELERRAKPAKGAPTDVVDVVILGGGVAGMAAAIEARLIGLSFEVIEANEPFATIADFPRGKPIFTYPMSLMPEGALQVRATVKEQLLDELRAQVERVGVPVTRARAERVLREGGALTVKLDGGGTRRARAVLVAIGRSGDFRRLGVPGESLDHVHVRLHDPADYAGRDVLVAGGGDEDEVCPRPARRGETRDGEEPGDAAHSEHLVLSLPEQQHRRQARRLQSRRERAVSGIRLRKLAVHARQQIHVFRASPGRDGCRRSCACNPEWRQ